MANATGGGEGSEIPRPVLGYLSSYVYPGKIFSEVYLQIWIGLIVLEPGIEMGSIPFDEIVFQYQGFRFGISNDELEIIELRDHAADF